MMVQVGQLSSGLLEKKDQRHILRQWRSMAEVRRQTVTPTLDSLSKLGIQVETQKSNV